MRWILTQRNMLINVDTIRTIHVLTRRDLKDRHIFEVAVDLNNFDEGKYISLTISFDNEEHADSVLEDVISWLVKDNSSNLLIMDKVVNEW